MGMLPDKWRRAVGLGPKGQKKVDSSVALEGFKTFLTTGVRNQNGEIQAAAFDVGHGWRGEVFKGCGLVEKLVEGRGGYVGLLRLKDQTELQQLALKSSSPFVWVTASMTPSEDPTFRPLDPSTAVEAGISVSDLQDAVGARKFLSDHTEATRCQIDLKWLTDHDQMEDVRHGQYERAVHANAARIKAQAPTEPDF
jgi:hypothetical protein